MMDPDDGDGCEPSRWLCESEASADAEYVDNVYGWFDGWRISGL